MGPGEFVTPNRDEVEQELTLLMRSSGKRNHRSKPSQLELLQGDDAPIPNKNSPGLWPAYKGPLPQDARNIGKSTQSWNLSVTKGALTGITPLNSGKYSHEGPFTREGMIAMGISPTFADAFARGANGSRSRSTWQQRKSVLSIIGTCARDLGVELLFPWGDTELQYFVGWLMDDDKKSSTILQYVSNVRSLHREMNLQMRDTKWDFFKQVIEGHSNLSQPTPGRIPMTPDRMFTLKQKLSESNLAEEDRRLIWAISTALFQGSFRIGELLSPKRKQFCPDTTLVWKYVKWEPTIVDGNRVDMMKFTIRSPKETRGSKKVEVEVFDMPGCFYSCTAAFRKWRNCSTLPEDPDLPVFRRKSGDMLTPRDMNGIIKALMQDSVRYEEGYISTHSFRGGMVSVMYRLGYSEEQIKIQGRWASDAFKHYCKSGRAARLKDQWNLATDISHLVSRCISNGEHLA